MISSPADAHQVCQVLLKCIIHHTPVIDIYMYCWRCGSLADHRFARALHEGRCSCSAATTAPRPHLQGMPRAAVKHLLAAHPTKKGDSFFAAWRVLLLLPFVRCTYFVHVWVHATGRDKRADSLCLHQPPFATLDATLDVFARVTYGSQHGGARARAAAAGLQLVLPCAQLC